MRIMFNFGSVCAHICDQDCNDDKKVLRHEKYSSAVPHEEEVLGAEFWTDGYYASTLASMK